MGQEDFVDEVEVFDALGDQGVDLGEKGRKVATAVLVAEVDLGAERAGVGATARGLDFGAGRLGWAIEAMMVVMVAADPFVGPVERGQVGEAAGLRAASLDEFAVAQCGGAGD